MRNYDLVIIGGGSAGMASAIRASDEGIKSIIILEKDDNLGGILLQCIHNGFGLQTFKEELTGPEYAYRYYQEIKKRNIEYKLNTMVLEITKEKEVIYSNEEEIVQIKAKAIICATGCSERTRGAINIAGDRVKGVLTAGLAQRYLNIEGYMIGKKVFILGSGDIGLIMARRMKLEGAEVLGVAELMPYSNGLNRNIVQCLNDFNIPLYLSHTVKRIIGKNHLEKIVLAQVDENLKFIENSEIEIEVDTLLLSVGLIPSNPLLNDINVKMNPKTKGPIVNEMMETSIPGIFSCGNSLHVHDLVDFVSSEASDVGYFASEYIKNNFKEIKNDPKEIKNDFKEEKNVLNVVPKTGISYLIPNTINLNKHLKVSLKFRVNKPYKNVKLIIKLDDEVLRTIKKDYLLPAEMEIIKIDLSEKYGKTLTVEVYDE